MHLDTSLQFSILSLKPYEISADFIMELGNAFLFAKAARLVKELN